VTRRRRINAKLPRPRIWRRSAFTCSTRVSVWPLESMHRLFPSRATAPNGVRNALPRQHRISQTRAAECDTPTRHRPVPRCLSRRPRARGRGARPCSVAAVPPSVCKRDYRRPPRGIRAQALLPQIFGRYPRSRTSTHHIGPDPSASAYSPRIVPGSPSCSPPSRAPSSRISASATAARRTVARRTPSIAPRAANGAPSAAPSSAPPPETTE